MAVSRAHRRLKLEELEPRVAPAVAFLYDAGASFISPQWFETLQPSGRASAPMAQQTDGLEGLSDALSAGLASEWIVQLSGDVLGMVRSVSDAAAFLAAQSAPFTVVEGLGMAGQMLLRSAEVGLSVAEDWLRSSGSFAYYEPNGLSRFDVLPNDANFAKLWALDNTGQTGGTLDADIDAPEAWSVTTGSPGIVVAVIDTGVDYTHPDLAANIWTNPREIPGNGVDDDGNGFVDDVHGYNFARNNGDPMDDNGHGTHVAGTIAAVGDNGIGVTGVNWTSSIMALKFLDSRGSGTISNAVRAINYATMMQTRYGVNVHVTNNSWGSYTSSQSLRDAIASSGNAGILFVAAAGNDGFNNDVTPLYPSGYNLNNIIAVAATDQNDLLARFSNYGTTSVDLGAPGVSIYSTRPQGAYGYLSGTSMATPHVTGVVALAWAAAPDAAAQTIRAAVFAGTDPVSSLAGKVATGGRLNARGALDALSAKPVVTVTATDPSASEQGAEPGVFTIARTGSTASALTVYYALSGTATHGVDYQSLPSAVTIAAGASSAVITIKPIDDALVEGNETVVFTIADAAAYTVGPRDSATVIIADNDSERRVFVSSDVPRTIPDLFTITSLLEIPDSLAISDLDVTVNISHTYDADLTVFLIGPSGVSVKLFAGVGGRGDNFTNTTLDDEAARPISSGSAPFSGTYRPQGKLSAFDGKSLQGTWTLWISDTTVLDSGVLNSWSISVAGQPVVPAPAQTSAKALLAKMRQPTNGVGRVLAEFFGVEVLPSLDGGKVVAAGSSARPAGASPARFYSMSDVVLFLGDPGRPAPAAGGSVLAPVSCVDRMAPSEALWGARRPLQSIGIGASAGGGASLGAGRILLGSSAMGRPALYPSPFAGLWVPFDPSGALSLFPAAGEAMGFQDSSALRDFGAAMDAFAFADVTADLSPAGEGLKSFASLAEMEKAADLPPQALSGTGRNETSS